ncbi:MAG: transporter substrate-binding domain-containing protein, partial [Campylobacterota bacterium]|nr:transporter substrate-binding domain-containing protein [Campylobacterota bacterium]
MKNILIYILLFITITLNANNNNEIEKDLASFAKLSASYLYEVDDEQLPIALEPYLIKYKHIKALKITEGDNDEVFMRYYKDKQKLIFNKQIPENLKKLKNISSHIQYDGETIGKIVIYYTYSQALNLTKKEEKWLNKQHPIKYVFDPDWEPFEWNNGLDKHTGIIADLFVIIKKNSKLNLIEIPSKNWYEAIKKVKEKKADMFSAVGITDDRKKYLNFTSKNLFSVPYVFVSRKGEDYSTGFDDLSKKVIAVNKNSTIQAMIEKEYPNVNLKLLSTEGTHSFNQLRNKEIDIFVVNSAKANFYIGKLGFNDLKVAYKTKLILELKIALSKDIPNEAITILDKSIDLIGDNVPHELLYKYTSLGDLFTNKEKRYLKQKKIINICTNPSWAPIEFNEEEKMQGISLDILDTIKTNLGLEYKFIKTKSWKESQQFLKERKCDILPSAIKTAKREIYANFTKPYLKYDLIIITHKDIPEVTSLEDIIDKKMSRKQGSGMIGKLKKQYPKIDITETKTTLESFTSIEDGKVDFTISTLPVFLYHKSKYGLENIKLSGYTPMKYNLSIAVRNDDKLLLSILNKSLKEVPEATNKIVHDKWAAPKTINKIDWDLMIKIFAIFILFLLGTLYWAKKLAAAKAIAEKATVEAQEAKLEADIAKKEVEAMHKHTRESIEYASMIQGALLPDENLMGNYFKDYFVHWMPKDTVGGDIWLFSELRHEDECLLFFIDCTGHGVPGAFVTMIVKAVEREIVSNLKKHNDFDISPAII